MERPRRPVWLLLDGAAVGRRLRMRSKVGFARRSIGRALLVVMLELIPLELLTLVPASSRVRQSVS
jgi:hypothetical protein